MVCHLQPKALATSKDAIQAHKGSLEYIRQGQASPRRLTLHERRSIDAQLQVNQILE